MNISKGTFIILVIILMLILVVVLVGYRFLQEQSVKKIIISFGKAIKTGQIEEIDSKFLSEAIFTFEKKQISYTEALERLNARISKGDIKGDMYVDSVHEISSKTATISFIFWVLKKGDSYEVSGIAEFEKTSLWNWKIIKITSKNSIFEKIFFQDF